MFWEGFAEELTAEPQWTKCSKTWSLSGQVPPLVPMARAKLNLLSAPLKLVSQDSERSLPSITSAGTKGRLPKGLRIRAICIHTQTIKAQQSHCDSLPFTPSQRSKWNAKCHGAAITVFFSTEEKLTKSERSLQCSKGAAAFVPWPIWGNTPCLFQRSTSNACFSPTNTPAIAPTPPDCSINQSINPSRWRTRHFIHKGRLQRASSEREKKMHSAAA